MPSKGPSSKVSYRHELINILVIKGSHRGQTDSCASYCAMQAGSNALLFTAWIVAEAGNTGQLEKIDADFQLCSADLQRPLALFLDLLNVVVKLACHVLHAHAVSGLALRASFKSEATALYREPRACLRLDS